MLAVTIDQQELVVTERPDPVPGAGEVVVRVHAAGLNGADQLQLRGAYPPPPGSPIDIPGLELAGEVFARGPGAERFDDGERVMAIVGGGAQAELCVVHERQLMPVPAALDWAQAGGLPETFTTAHDALFTQADLKLGERVLISGAAGGVGTAAVQLASAAGAHVTASVRDESRREEVAALGADVVCSPDESDALGPYDVLLELIGGPNMDANFAALASQARVVVIGVGGGFRSELNLLALMGSRAKISGSTLRARPLEEKAATARALEKQVLGGFDDGTFTVPLFKTFSLKEAAAAYASFANGGKLGKIVLVTEQ
ncbi:MAG: zinc-binding dehydrogenase [Actinomycetes bacterium]|jgi:NADPH:quinone reductase